MDGEEVAVVVAVDGREVDVGHARDAVAVEVVGWAEGEVLCLVRAGLVVGGTVEEERLVSRSGSGSRIRDEMARSRLVSLGWEYVLYEDCVAGSSSFCPSGAGPGLGGPLGVVRRIGMVLLVSKGVLRPRERSRQHMERGQVS